MHITYTHKTLRKYPSIEEHAGALASSSTSSVWVNVQADHVYLCAHLN